MVKALRRLRGRHLFVMDTIGIVAAAYFAVAFRNISSVPDWMIGLILMVVAVHLVINVRFGLYTHDWRFASVPDLARIVSAVVCGALIAGGLLFAIGLLQPGLTYLVPLTFWPIELLLVLVVVGGLRFGIRAVFDLALDPSGRRDR